MPARCIVGGCSNTAQEGVSLHSFPKEPNLRRLWTSKVKLTRASWDGPSKWSMVCSDHFLESDFDDGLHATFDMKRTRRLRDDAVPTIKSKTSKPKEMKRSGTRTAAEKRKKMRMLDELLATSSQELQEVPDSEELSSTEDQSSVESPSDINAEPGCSHWANENQPEPSGPITEQDSVMDVQLELTASVGTQVSVATRVKRTQKSVQVRDTGCQVEHDLSLLVSRGTSYDLADLEEVDQPEEHEDGDVEPEPEPEPESDTKEPSSPGYEPPSSSSSSSSSDKEHLLDTPEKPRKRRRKGQSPRTSWEPKQRSVPPHVERKYIIFESKLLELLRICPSCSGIATLHRRELGTLLQVTRECLACSASTTTWESQPWIGSLPAGNILLSAAILFAGGSCRETLRVLESYNITTFSERTFFRHQDQILHPAITKQWQLTQERIIQRLADQGLPLTIGGDGRADSPGHSAKFGVYTAIELNINKIVDFQLVQSNEVKSSYHMELEGYKRVTSYLSGKGLVIRKVVTDRHRQLAKHIREKTPDTIHVYDVWHVAKGVRKKVHALAKQKGCEELLHWEKSINNHMYWVAATCKEEEDALRVAKWKSLMNHIQGIHQGHSETFPKCLHKDEAAEGRQKKWLNAGTKACEKLDDILTNTMLVNDVKKLSGDKQTSSLEAFHSLVNHYAPKLKSYSYEGMTSRLSLAAMDYNENSDRKQATTVKGEKRYKVSKPKFKPGKASVKAVKEAKTFSYVDDLMTDISRLSTDFRPHSPERKAAPPSLCSQHTYLSKEELVQQHRSRFNLDD